MKMRLSWRRLLGFIIAAVMIISLQLPVAAYAAPESGVSAWDGATATQWTKGSGTAEDPYLIESAENLAYLRDQVNGGKAANSTNLGEYEGVWFKQTADIDLGNITWKPIGVYASSNSARAFSGHYDGGGHTISGLKVSMAGSTAYSNNTIGSGAGLFAYVKGNTSTRASIEGLVVEGSVDQTSTGTMYTAGLAGYAAYTDITNCGNEAAVTNAGQPTAGITGNCYYSTIDGCFNHGNITSTYTSSSYAAGIAGQAANNSNFNTSITNCYNTGNVSSSYYAGGIVSQVYGNSTSAAHTFGNCYNTGTITATVTTGNNVNVAGGIIGYISSGKADYASAQTMTNCFTLAGSAPQALIGNNQPTWMTITNSGERSDEYMKSAEFVSELGEKFIKGADYPGLYWEAPDGIPVITTQPTDAVYVIGASASALSVAATGDAANGSIVYQWYKASNEDLSDAAAISGADSGTYVPAANTLGDCYYYCTVHNDVQAADGSGPYMVRSGVAHVQVWSGAEAVAPIITTQPSSIAEIGQTETVGNELTVAAQFGGADENDSNAVLSYQWQGSDEENGTFEDVAGATEATFAAPTEKVGTKYYRCVVTTTREKQSKASVTSEAASVTVVGLTIATEAQLKAFASAVDSGSDFENCTVTVTEDITVTGTWNPIGTGAVSQLDWKPFKGEFDGDKHTITFATDDAESGYYALFGAVGAGADIHDLVVAGSMKSNGVAVAGVVAQVQGTATIAHAGNEAEITSGSTSAASSTAGLVGIVSNGTLTVTDCYNKGNISASGARNGGLVGQCAAGVGMSASVKVASSYNTGAVTTALSGYAYTAGIVGYASPAPTISNTYNTGTVSTPNSSNTASGAIFGGSSFANPTDDNVSYWLDTSCARSWGSTSARTGLISKTAEEFADETGETGVLALLKVGGYAEKWQEGSVLASGAQASPALSWEKKQEVVKPVVTFDPNGGTLAEGTVSPVEVEEGATVEKPADPSMNARLFEGWYLGDAEYDFATPVTEDITITAKWSTKRNITITVKNAPADVNMVYEDLKTGESREFSKTMSGTTAMFLGTNSANAGNYYGSHDVKITLSSAGYEDLVIESPGKDGTNNISKSNLEMTPIAYAITYELDGGTNAEGNPASYTIATETVNLADPAKEGSHFLGWFGTDDFSGDALTEIAKGSSGDITLYAKWEAHVPGETVIENEKAAGYDTDASYDEAVYCTVCGEELSRTHCTQDQTSLKYEAEEQTEAAAAAFAKAEKAKDDSEAYELAQAAVTSAADALNAAKEAQSAAETDEQKTEAAVLVSQAQSIFDQANEFLKQAEEAVLGQEMQDVLDAAIISLARLDRLVDESTYTADTWKAYDDAYSAFQALAKNPDGATAADVRAARSAVTKAYTKLEVKAVQNLTASAGTAKTGYATLAKAAKAFSTIKASGNVGTLSYKKAAGSSAYAAVNAKTGAITLKKGTPAGKHTVKVTVSAAATDDYSTASKTVTSTITVTKAKQTMTAKAKAVTVKAAKVKKAKQTVTALTVKNAKGTKSYKKTSGSAKLSVNAKTGKVTVKKGTKKGTYKVKIKVTAKGNANYSAASKTVTVKVKVK